MIEITVEVAYEESEGHNRVTIPLTSEDLRMVAEAKALTLYNGSDCRAGQIVVSLTDGKKGVTL